MATHNLDVAFSSHETANDPTVPIAMAYGFTNNTHGGTFKGKGQRKQTVEPGATVYFYVYDTAHDSTYNVTSVQISAVNKSHGANGAKSPFTEAAWANGSITAPTQQVPLSGPNPQAISTGCNIKDSRSWGIGSFTVGQFRGQEFQFTITVTATDTGQQSQKTFIVDPEVMVGDANK